MSVRPVNPTTLGFEALDFPEPDFVLSVCFLPPDKAFLESLVVDFEFDTLNVGLDDFAGADVFPEFVDENFLAMEWVDEN